MKYNYYIILVMLFAGIAQTFAQAPKVQSFSPYSGPVGTKIIIKGSGFSADTANNAVYFGATRAAINMASTSQLSVTVPLGATFKPITVINKKTGLIGYSTLAFSPSFPHGGTALAPPVRLTPYTPASAVQIADIDGDGKTDILATNPVQGTLMVFRNKSKPGKIDTTSFAAPLTYQIGSQSSFVAIDDMDGNGKTDVVLLNIGYTDTLNWNNSLTIFKNESTPENIKLSAVPLTDTSATTPSGYRLQLKRGDYVARVSDLDSDGKPDIAILNTAGFITVYRNTYDGGKSLKSMLGKPDTITVGLNQTSFVIGDIDSDGKPDIITASRDSSTLTVLRNISIKGSVTAASFRRNDFKLDYVPLTLSVADIDRDGKLDIAISRPGNKLVLLRNTSTAGQFSITSLVFSNLKILSNYDNDIVIQDADGDGKPDLLSLNDDLNSVQLFTNKSTPGETKQEYFNGGTSCKVVTIPDCIGDLDGDGRPDMIIGNYFGIDIYHSTPSLVIPPLIQPPVTEVTEDYLVLYPNPASTYTNVKYNLPARSDVLITVHNNFGKVMSSFKTGEQAAGDHINYIKTADLKMGIYVVTVSAGTYNKAGKLIIK